MNIDNQRTNKPVSDENLIDELMNYEKERLRNEETLIICAVKEMQKLNDSLSEIGNVLKEINYNLVAKM